MAGFSPSSKRSLGGGRGPTGWCYEIEGTEHGPIPFRTLRTMALEHKLLGHHLVWKDGSGEKVKASAVVGLIPPPLRALHTPPRSNSSNNPYSTPTAGNIADGPPGGVYLPHLHPANFPLYLASLALGIGLPIWLFAFSDDPRSEHVIASLLSLAGLGILAWLILSLVYLHRAWTMMRTFGASLTGNRAVRFLFIPFFNALWCFVALFGWARFWNFNVRNHPGLQMAQPVWPAFFFLFPILFLISQGLLLMHLFVQEWPADLTNPQHLVSLGTWVATLVIAITCWGQITRSINFLARKKF